MKRGRRSYRWLSALIVLLLAILNCTFPPQSPTYAEHYVSVKGSDTTGNGTLAKPWRHIQYAIDHAPAPAAGKVVRINLLKGIYQENLVIKRPLAIHGAGVGVPSVNAGDPLVPIQEISLIQRQNAGSGPGILIQDATSVTLEDLVVYGGGLRVVNSRFNARNIEVQQSLGLYAIQIEKSFFFYIEDSRIMTGTNNSDYALDVMASSGDVFNTYFGDRFDHVINISPLTLGETHNPYDPFPGNNVRIYDSEIVGSDISYADGVRIVGPIHVTIQNTTIKRPAGAQSGNVEGYDYPHAAVEIRGYQFDGSHLVTVDGLTTSGFAVGIGYGMQGFDLKVENSSISGLIYDVHGVYNNPQGAPKPTIDFGGGPRGSKGGNIFDAAPQYAFFHDGPYDVWACHNNWKVLTPQIDPLRIFDKLDASTRGRVKWDCSNKESTPVGVVTQPLVVVTATASRTPTTVPDTSSSTVQVKKDDLCYEGPGAAFEVVSAVKAGATLSLLGLGEGGGYYVVINPIYNDPCWLPIGSGDYTGDPNQLRIIPRPLQPTATTTVLPGFMVP